ncbi:MAG TPA: hypothetical protein VH560_14050 [Polyangia bacterium]|nr:hypothetical protein [Polyangia bacterium]
MDRGPLTDQRLDAGGAPDASLPPVAGYWRLFGFEDPVVVHIELDPDGSGYVTGRGCDVDWGPLFEPSLYDDRGYCGDLRGQGAGLSVGFSFDFPKGLLNQTAHYAASVYASKDGTRMAGSITTAFGDAAPALIGRGFGWFRLEDLGITHASDEETFPPVDLGPFPGSERFNFVLALQGDAAVGALVPGQTYVESLDTFSVWLTGPLGAFWNPDFHWNEATRTFTAGPVPETIPGVPVKIEFHLDASDDGLRDAVVTLADGTTGTLVPVRD